MDSGIWQGPYFLESGSVICQMACDYIFSTWLSCHIQHHNHNKNVCFLYVAASEVLTERRRMK